MTRGIFCIEGLWDNNLKRKSSVQPILSMLELNAGIPFIYHDAATTEELEFYISKWKQPRLKNYPILYLAFHGAKSAILIEGRKYSLDLLAQKLKDSCAGNIIIFASCKTLRDSNGIVPHFLDSTKALALFGYRNKVNWMTAAALELLILAKLQNVTFSGRGMRAIERKITSLASAFPQIDYLFMIQQKAIKQKTTGSRRRGKMSIRSY
ncbi:MAG: hypothetical protein LBI42_06600 [Chitinispirillales bacterium]|jgi:hypothetical protein|nr:hypothetical protein [Chitinispirillales bacterium]